MTEKKETRKLVRCVNSGVFFGELKKLEGTKAVLKNARNIWSWEGARIKISACINELFEIKVDNDVAVVDLAKRLKTIDKLAKSIRDNIKFLTAEYTLV